MDLTLWIIQALLALIFLGAGTMKLSRAPDALIKRVPALAGLPLPFIRFLGAAEVIGAAGLILPTALRIAPALTPAAAVGLMLVMLGAIAVNATHKQYAKIGVNVLLLLLAVLVAYGRLVLAPVAA